MFKSCAHESTTHTAMLTNTHCSFKLTSKVVIVLIQHLILSLTTTDNLVLSHPLPLRQDEFLVVALNLVPVLHSHTMVTQPNVLVFNCL